MTERKKRENAAREKDYILMTHTSNAAQRDSLLRGLGKLKVPHISHTFAGVHWYSYLRALAAGASTV